ncbi:PhzF family phenazine biosynthesis protein [Tropicimonas sp. S265A]|uniref:PhzF family phenazine biosynthesis protein n=1 Tax=Tropicimonas sp. S265A TaxID=3415134 RepID=UPI003C79DB67
MRQLNFATCDVFTEQRYTGNPLAIVEGAEGLSTAQMQTIAREFNLSETIFVLPPRDPAHTARVRIFFPTDEIPFAGHPTIGCAIHLAVAEHGASDFETRITLEEEAGLVPVQVTQRDGRIVAELQAPVLPHAHAGTIEPDLLAAALGLPPSALGFDGHRPALFAGGPAFLYAPVADARALRMARPLEPAWAQVMTAGNVDSVYVYCRAAGGFAARMFAPTAGIPEDPATGSAAAILAAQLLAADDIRGDTHRVTVAQGMQMGRPSTLNLRIVTARGRLKEVYVGGSAVPVSSGTLTVPDA